MVKVKDEKKEINFSDKWELNSIVDVEQDSIQIKIYMNEEGIFQEKSKEQKSNNIEEKKLSWMKNHYILLIMEILSRSEKLIK